MTNAEWLVWFDGQSRDMKRAIMASIDALENDGYNGRLAHEAVMVWAMSGVSPHRIAAIMKANEVLN